MKEGEVHWLLEPIYGSLMLQVMMSVMKDKLAIMYWWYRRWCVVCLESKTVSWNSSAWCLKCHKLALSMTSTSRQENWLRSKAKTCHRSHRQETLGGLSVLNSQGRKKNCSGWHYHFSHADCASVFQKNNFDWGVTNGAEKRWKGCGSCYSFCCNIFSPLLPAASQSGMATPCGVQSCANAQDVSNYTPIENHDF